jgi:hypothetical protein
MRLIQVIVILPGLVLLSMALWFQYGGTLRIFALTLVAAVMLALGRFWVQGRVWQVWIWATVATVAALGWYSTLRPSNDRTWAVDVEHGVTADVQGDVVTLTNVRNFDWRTADDFTPRWETRSYRLDQLSSVDLFTSVWGNPSIAHIMIGFGFDDGQHVVFSAEIRREKGEVYSALAGFFRRYELVIIAADERDLIRLRTDVRDNPRETVSLFPLTMRPEKRRELFLEYLSLADTLSVRPEWYNTATTNCTTVPWRLARALAPGLPLNRDVLLSGHFPRYLWTLGVVSPGQPLDEVLARAVRKPVGPAGEDGAEFSRRLRDGLAPSP